MWEGWEGREGGAGVVEGGAWRWEVGGVREGGGERRGLMARLCGPPFWAWESRNLERTAAAERGSFRGAGGGRPPLPAPPAASAGSGASANAVELSNSAGRTLGSVSVTRTPLCAQRYIRATCGRDGVRGGHRESHGPVRIELGPSAARSEAGARGGPDLR